jgi:hypothetical protein
MDRSRRSVASRLLVWVNRGLISDGVASGVDSM